MYKCLSLLLFVSEKKKSLKTQTVILDSVVTEVLLLLFVDELDRDHYRALQLRG